MLNSEIVAMGLAYPYSANYKKVRSGQFQAACESEVQSTLVEKIEEIRNRLQGELESYRESNTAFIDSKNTLLKRLMMLKYTTKLNFEKKKIRRKCPLV
jgi:hypothetical protein